MAIEQSPIGDLTLAEVRSVISTMIEIPADKIEDWMIVVKLPCDRCGRPYCGDGALATISSRQGVTDDGSRLQEPAFELHLTSKLIESLAEQWSDESMNR